MSGGSSRGFHRVKMWAARGATSIAVIASIATSPSSAFEEVELPDRAVVLDAAHPEERSRFRVRSNDGKFDLLFTFVTEQAANPSFHLTFVEGANGKVVQLEEIDSLQTPTRIERSYTVVAECPREFPCEMDFETTLGADVASEPAVQGSLGIRARFTDPAKADDRYLAIDEL